MTYTNFTNLPKYVLRHVKPSLYVLFGGSGEPASFRKFDSIALAIPNHLTCAHTHITIHNSLTRSISYVVHINHIASVTVSNFTWSLQNGRRWGRWERNRKRYNGRTLASGSAVRRAASITFASRRFTLSCISTRRLDGVPLLQVWVHADPRQKGSVPNDAMLRANNTHE